MTFDYYTSSSLKSKEGIKKPQLSKTNAYANIKNRKVIMPDQDQTNNTTTGTNPPATPLGSADMPTATAAPTADAPADDAPQPIIDDAAVDASEDAMKEIASKISEVHNILVALSSDPSVDEIAAAIGLSICLDRVGKRATSIYSGQTPNALEFLKPENTFETTADVLKDFVIALDKDKADHLRYKLDGDYVKIFITPYKSRIDEEDLEFSYGDFNIEFVLALNVANGIDLDDALREHGRVMHDAAIANMTTGNPGKFGDIEWSDKTASSVCEMAAKLLYSIGGKDALTGEEATAFLTGIVSATDHFTNAKTTANALRIASELMKSGADRQLIADNISLDSENMFMFSGGGFKDAEEKEGPTSLTISHDGDDEEPKEEEPKEDKESKREPTPIIEKAEKKEEPKDEPKTEEETENADLLKDLEAAAAGLAAGDVTTPEAEKEPLRLDEPEKTEEPTINSEPAPSTDFSIPTAPEIETAPETPAATETTEAPSIPETPAVAETPETQIPTASEEVTLTPSTDFAADDSTSEGGTKRYSQMLEEALAEANTSNPAVASAPEAPTEPEINGVPEINYNTVPNDELLPPPPAPPVDLANVMPPEASTNS